MRILLTNDDGIHAPGILALKKRLETLGEVRVVAPERQRSAAGHGMTLHKPLRITPVKLADGSDGFAISGTPTDCVILGLDVVCEGECDLVVSGINLGSNLGWDVTYSGTVAAAFEAAILNRPAIAISLALDRREDGQVPDFQTAARFAGFIAQQLLNDPLPPHTFLNVNVPAIPEEEIAGAVITHQGRREYRDRIVARNDPAGRPYYWQYGNLHEGEPDPGSDVHAVLNRQISVTPIQLDLTAYSVMDKLREWKI